ncbi:hypothetical protein, partial [Secundilactobacillus similis]|uniref:hypothetical protein n=1 Tax=Secundilactobacillus similis TaxID=414682 RepID=UPI0031E10FF5
NPPGPGAFTDVALHTALNPSRSAHYRWTQTTANQISTKKSTSKSADFEMLFIIRFNSLN